MKKLVFIVFILLSSCTSNSKIIGLHERSIQQGETTWFNIKAAKGYFYKDYGFVLVENADGERIMMRCVLDTMTVIKKIPQY